MSIENHSAYAVVTGAQGDIGSAILRELHQLGMVPVEVDLAPPSGAEVTGIHYNVNLSDADATRLCALEIAERYEPTTFVHCAGNTFESPLEQVNTSDLSGAWNLHCGAAVWFVQAMLPALARSRTGRIVLIGSRASLGLANRTSYSASKASLEGLARTWALELSPLGVTVNIVSPGPIATNMFRGSVPEGSSAEQAIISTIPLGRLGYVDDIARAVAFFCAPHNNWITGQNLFVCGGTSISGVPLYKGIQAYETSK